LGRTALSRRARLERVSGRLQPAPLRHRVERCGERLDVLAARAGQALLNAARHRHRLLDAQAKLLASLSYQSVLARGYALVRDAEGTMIRAAAAISAGQRLEIEFKDGRIAADAVSGSAPKTQPESENRPAREAPAAPHKRGTPGQGSLF
jgi:exodeoxyribonuclease VII large subunit